MTLMLKYMAAKGQEPDGLEDNPYQEALDDPEYMNHLWVTENGSSIIPEEIVAYFKYALDQPINEDQVFLQDDANLRDMLDTWPWVTISMSNRCAATIRRDATGSKTKMSDYYTNNYMDFNAGNLVEYLHTSRNTDYSTAP